MKRWFVYTLAGVALVLAVSLAVSIHAWRVDASRLASASARAKIERGVITNRRGEAASLGSQLKKLRGENSALKEELKLETQLASEYRALVPTGSVTTPTQQSGPFSNCQYSFNSSSWVCSFSPAG